MTSNFTNNSFHSVHLRVGDGKFIEHVRSVKSSIHTMGYVEDPGDIPQFSKLRAL